MTAPKPNVDVGNQFREFIEVIALSGSPEKRIESAISGVRSVAVAGLDELNDDEIIIQGSYANGTAIEPGEGGAYDVDIVLPAFERSTGATAALNMVEQVFKDNGNYADKVEPKTPCIRLNYADDDIGQFHVDLVPARPADEGSDAPLEIPRRDAGWHETAPAEFTMWCEEQGEAFARTVMVLKRWRDENQGVRAAIKSIVLQVLVRAHLTEHHDDASRLATTLQNISHDLAWRSAPPTLPNPVLESENLAARWTDAAFEDFKTKISAAATQAESALSAAALEDACDRWRDLLGPDFPAAPASEYGIQLSDTSHESVFSAMGWSRSTFPMELEVLAHVVRSRKKGVRPRPYKGQVLRAGTAHLRFRLNSEPPAGSEVKWQVVNTGGHARDDNGLRGDFNDAQTRCGSPSNDPLENWEGTRYTGKHRIRAVAVRGPTVVAESRWIEITIVARGVPFRM